jgi:hypothetical protein
MEYLTNLAREALDLFQRVQELARAGSKMALYRLHLYPEQQSRLDVPIACNRLCISEEYCCSSAYYSLRFRDGMSY